jgi:hypothetical protein
MAATTPFFQLGVARTQSGLAPRGAAARMAVRRGSRAVTVTRAVAAAFEDVEALWCKVGL